MTGNDHSVVLLGWRDTELGFDCTFKRLLNGEAVCLPSEPQVFNGYKDADCASPVVDVVGVGFFGPILDVQRTSVYEVSSAEYNGPRYQFASDTGCLPTLPCEQTCFDALDVVDDYVHGPYSTD